MSDRPPRRPFPLRVLRLFGSLIRGFVLGLGMIVVIVVALGYWGLHRIRTEHRKPLPAHFSLLVDLNDAPPDAPIPSGLFAVERDQRPTLEQTVVAIDRAAHDARVRGIDIKLAGGCCSLTTAEELHDALARFRKVSGKPVTVRAISFDGAAGLGGYVVAAAASRIEISAVGDFAVTGISLQTPFAAGLLKTVGVTAQFAHVGKYKDYPQLYTRTSPTPASHEMMNSLADSLYSSAIAPIAARLKQAPDQVKAIIDQAPFSAAHAKQAGLVDAILPVTARLERFPGRHVSLADYIGSAPPPPPGTPKVAVIMARGMIEAPSITARGNKIDPGRLAHEIAGAIDDKSVKAIVLRVDSPGGTVIGSAVIGAEVARAAAKHKPLIVSMGAVDASGGYWISCHGAVLVADRTTLTGSIGVFAGKLTFAPLMQRLGINVDGAARGANALYDSPVTPWTPAQLADLQGMLNLSYQQFLDWVASGRHMSAAQVNAVGQGRVWTGVQAKKNGLVDRLGGYHEAFAVVRSELHLTPDARLDIVSGNQPPGFRQLLAEVVRRVNPLGLAELPPGLREVVVLSHLHRLSMIPIEIH